MTPQEVLDEVVKYGAPELEALVDGLCPCLAAFPLAALMRLADEAVKAITAKNEFEAMRSAVKAADQAADVAEAEALKS